MSDMIIPADEDPPSPIDLPPNLTLRGTSHGQTYRLSGKYLGAGNFGTIYPAIIVKYVYLFSASAIEQVL